MQDWSNYQQNSTLRKPTYLSRYSVVYQKLLQEKLQLNKNKNNSQSALTAIDLGCGGGVDSIFFAKRGFEIYAVDQDTKVIENTIKILLSQGKLTQEEFDRIHIIKSNFEDIANGKTILPKADIVYSNASLPFYKPQEISQFNNLLSSIQNTTKEGGIVATTLFGKNDAWEQSCTLLNKDEIEASFNDLQPVQFGEKVQVSPTQSGDIKQWDFIESVYRKPFTNSETETMASSINSNSVIEILANQENNLPSPLSTIADETFAAMNIETDIK